MKDLTVKEWLLAPEPRDDIPIPPRGRWRHREPLRFDDEPTPAAAENEEEAQGEER